MSLRSAGSIRLRLSFRLFAILLLGFGPGKDLLAQTPPPTLRLQTVSPGGVRLSVTDSSGVLEFSLENPTSIDRQARLLVFYETDPDVQYGKDFWIPASSKLVGSMPIGPAPKENSNQMRNIQFLLYDRTDGTDRLIKPPGEEVRRSRGLFYQRREPSTVLFLDEFIDSDSPPGTLPKQEPFEQEAVQFVQLLRKTQGISSLVYRLYGRRLPASPEAFAGIDHFILASSQLADDPVGVRALRQWVRQGGLLWVMLDRTDLSRLGGLFEDAVDFELLDRTSLNQFAIEESFKIASAPEKMTLERPVDFVRVVLPVHEKPPFTLDGWPVLFTRKLGQGNVVFTTLGPRATYRHRTTEEIAKLPRNASQSEIDDARLPVANASLRSMSRFLKGATGEQPFPVQTFAKVLDSQIGYRVVGLRTVAALFGLFLLAEILLGWFLRRTGRSMLLLWVIPLTSMATGAVFLALGSSSRSAEATMAIGQVVNAVDNRSEVSVHGLMAVYQPDAGPLVATSQGGGSLELDRKGLEEQIGRRVMTDLDSWHWENLRTPAGIRLSPFRFIAPIPEPIEAVLKFTPSGLEGTVLAAPFQNVGDAVFAGPGDRRSMVSLNSSGSVELLAKNMLPANEFFSTTTLSDRQQKRLELLRGFVKSDEFKNLKKQNVLVAWADPIDAPFNRASPAKRVGEALMLVPVRLERPQPGSRITVPASFIPYSRIVEGMSVAISDKNDQPIDIHLRFQLPLDVLPLKVEQARFTGKISAPLRRITLKGGVEPKLNELYRVDSPLDTIRVDLPNPATLSLDNEGGLHLHLSIGQLLEEPADPLQKPYWTIEFLELEVSGETLDSGK